MNTNSNIYTILYSAIIVILVAAILAFASVSLRPRQEANQKAETISQMLTATHISSKEELDKLNNEEILKKYVQFIDQAFIINSKGEKIKDLNMGKESISNIEIFTEKELKTVNKSIKDNNTDKIELPVYIFNNNGTKFTVLPIYGGGLWGPVWGYIAYKEDLKTIIGAYFDHESETPGLGAKIKDDPSFRAQFDNREISINQDMIFGIIKGGAKDQTNAIDAITGATLTSNGLNNAINSWLKTYIPYIKNNSKCNDTCSMQNTSCGENKSCNESCSCKNKEQCNDSCSCSNNCKETEKCETAKNEEK